MASKGIIVWRGDMGRPTNHYSKTQIPDANDTPAVSVLATALAAYSTANIAKYSWVQSAVVTDEKPGATPSANVDYRAIVYFRNTTTGNVHSVTIPAFLSTAVEETPEGDRVTDAAMIAIVAAIATATGETLVPLHGVVIQKR